MKLSMKRATKDDAHLGAVQVLGCGGGVVFYSS
jgi:hypothetical protein